MECCQYPIGGYEYTKSAFNLVRFAQFAICAVCVGITIYMVIHGTGFMAPTFVVILAITSTAYAIVTFIDVIATSYLKPIFWNAWILFAMSAVFFFCLCVGLLLATGAGVNVMVLVATVFYALAAVIFLCDVLVLLYLLMKSDLPLYRHDEQMLEAWKEKERERRKAKRARKAGVSTDDEDLEEEEEAYEEKPPKPKRKVRPRAEPEYDEDYAEDYDDADYGDAGGADDRYGDDVGDAGDRRGDDKYARRPSDYDDYSGGQPHREGSYASQGAYGYEDRMGAGPYDQYGQQQQQQPYGDPSQPYGQQSQIYGVAPVYAPRSQQQQQQPYGQPSQVYGAGAVPVRGQPSTMAPPPGQGAPVAGAPSQYGAVSVKGAPSAVPPVQPSVYTLPSARQVCPPCGRPIIAGRGRTPMSYGGTFPMGKNAAPLSPGGEAGRHPDRVDESVTLLDPRTGCALSDELIQKGMPGVKAMGGEFIEPRSRMPVTGLHIAKGEIALLDIKTGNRLTGGQVMNGEPGIYYPGGVLIDARTGQPLSADQLAEREPYLLNPGTGAPLTPNQISRGELGVYYLGGRLIDPKTRQPVAIDTGGGSHGGKMELSERSDSRQSLSRGRPSSEPGYDTERDTDSRRGSRSAESAKGYESPKSRHPLSCACCHCTDEDDLDKVIQQGQGLDTIKETDYDTDSHVGRRDKSPSSSQPVSDSETEDERHRGGLPGQTHR